MRQVIRVIGASLASALGVSAQFIRVMIRGSRRLQNSESLANLWESWEAGYEVDVLPEEAESVSSVANTISGDRTILRKHMQDQLVMEGVDETIAQSGLDIGNFTAELSAASDQTTSPSIQQSATGGGTSLSALIAGVVGAVAGLACMTLGMGMYLRTSRRQEEHRSVSASIGEEMASHVGDQYCNDCDEGEVASFSV